MLLIRYVVPVTLYILLAGNAVRIVHEYILALSSEYSGSNEIQKSTLKSRYKRCQDAATCAFDM